MEDLFNYINASEIICNRYNYMDGEFLISTINDLDIIKDDSIIYPKNLKLLNKNLELYIFNKDKIYKVYKKDEETVELKLFDKNRIKNIIVSLSYEKEYSISFSIENETEYINSSDVSGSYSIAAKNTLKELIKYFNK